MWSWGECLQLLLWNKYWFYHCLCCLYLFFIGSPWLLEYLIALFTVYIEILAFNWGKANFCHLVYDWYLETSDCFSLLLSSYQNIFQFNNFHMYFFGNGNNAKLGLEFVNSCPQWYFAGGKCESAPIEVIEWSLLLEVIAFGWQCLMKKPVLEVVLLLMWFGRAMNIAAHSTDIWNCQTQWNENRSKDVKCYYQQRLFDGKMRYINNIKNLRSNIPLVQLSSWWLPNSSNKIQWELKLLSSYRNVITEWLIKMS